LGYWRRAVVWAALPLLVDLTFVFLVLRFEVRVLYGCVPTFQRVLRRSPRTEPNRTARAALSSAPPKVAPLRGVLRPHRQKEKGGLLSEPAFR